MIKIPIFAHTIKKNKVIPTSKPSVSINQYKPCSPSQEAGHLWNVCIVTTGRCVTSNNTELPYFNPCELMH